MPWYLWFLLGFGLFYIGLIFWFCLKKYHDGYNQKTSKYCSLIIVMTILIILASILTIALVI